VTWINLNQRKDNQLFNVLPTKVNTDLSCHQYRPTGQLSPATRTYRSVSNPELHTLPFYAQNLTTKLGKSVEIMAHEQFSDMMAHGTETGIRGLVSNGKFFPTALPIDYPKNKTAQQAADYFGLTLKGKAKQVIANSVEQAQLFFPKMIKSLTRLAT
jgi:hypothetical protein